MGCSRNPVERVRRLSKWPKQRTGWRRLFVTETRDPDESPDVSPDETKGEEELTIKKKNVQGREAAAFTRDYSPPRPQSLKPNNRDIRDEPLSDDGAVDDEDGSARLREKFEPVASMAVAPRVEEPGEANDAVRGQTTNLDGQPVVTRVAHKDLEALVQERRIRSPEETVVSAALSSMERHRQVDAATVSVLQAELGLNCTRVEDDKAHEQSRYDSALVQARALFESEKREMLFGSEKNNCERNSCVSNMNGELQSDLKKIAEPSDLVSREELQSERKVLEETPAGLVSGQAALAQKQARLNEAKRG
ncbi:hypothetical protein H257_15992 [Aphanomyces astaci]|uniref:Uncharacterized protein n=1 Tax=Aphanomyces astaci TaxID=112090 RepID=W4FMD9_APHAT|nr:hypothetical protein H257_15992 [Aphanomyces astaci]ETV67868.1 hypothetical protein H257_15992 [Aphanomyces astaci]|eukprot:XP_009842613.1 hypothetical protein H257_15992 [Aphanomyces astaci]